MAIPLERVLPMKKRELKNFAYHVLLALVLVSLVLVHRYFLLLDVFIWAALREQAQHRYDFDAPAFVVGDCVVPRKRTFSDFGWLGGKQVGEIFQCVLGAFLALGAYELLLWFKIVGN